MKQDKLIEAAFNILKTQIPSDFLDLLSPSPTEKNKNRALLEKHLKDYTARNTFDYFIHKDLGGFLRRELDFFIKNEVLHLDDINTLDDQDFIRQLSQVRAFKVIGLKIIAFLEQLENFQQKLWLKKKFVVETNYCITLDKIPEDYYPEIAENDTQWHEWEVLFTLSEIPRDLFSDGAESDRMTILQSQPHLVLDTKFFSESFRNRLLAEFDNLDEEIDGLLINSENFQALELLQGRYKEQVKCIYIDPPYNAKSSEIVYKNNFKHSSFATFIENRMKSSSKLLKNAALINVAIDDYEVKRVNIILDQIFGGDNFISNILVIHNPRGRNDDRFYGTAHEYMLVYSNNKAEAQINNFPLDEESSKQYNKRDSISEYAETSYMRTGNNSNRFERPNLFYPIYINPENLYLSLEEVDNWVKVLPINSSGEEKTWRWGKTTFLDKKDTELFVKNSGNNYRIYKKRRKTNAGKKPKTIWHNSRYDASTNGIMLLRGILGEKNLFSYPKSLWTVYDALQLSTQRNYYILDYFAGSGTTGHAVINLNREDDGNRKYILVEMGEYFNTVTKPRIQKVIYSKDWKNGKPISREGSSHMFKYIRLESYEDTLNNLALKRTDAQGLALTNNTEFKEGYLLNYMLDTEAQESLLDISAFEDPFNYYLNITKDNEMKPTKVDLVETFNYLIGLVVERVDTIRGFKVIEGHSLEGERILVIWRNTKEKSNEELNNFFQKMGYSTRDNEFDRIYINGDNNLENLRTDEDRWKVVMIDEEFKKRMFDVTNI